MTTSVGAVTELTDDLVELVAAALRELTSHRGGPQLRTTIVAHTGASEPVALTETLVDRGSLYVAHADGSPAGILAVTPADHLTIMGVYVRDGLRRRHVATSLLSLVFDSPIAPNDAWVLPGDRATKSLYEQAGWKARMLTMSGE